ncbi:MAG: hypothetical protein EOP67_64885 [Sphingomonas sp.]|nr:MAG: hypothetical protein EOP67_64885 [Sphingomonas sp.]
MLESRATAMEGRVVQLARRTRQATGGVAAAMALGGATLPPGANTAVTFNLATYRGEQGFAGSGIAKVTRHVYVSGGIAGSTVRRSTGGRVGVTLGW